MNDLSLNISIKSSFSAFYHSWPGIPLIYSGQEKPNYKRLAFFEKDAIDWSGEVELHTFYQTMLRLRKKNKALQESASVLIITTGEPEVLVYLCRRQSDKVLVMINFSKTLVSFSVNHPAIAGNYRDIFDGQLRQMNRKETVALAPGDFLALEHTVEA